MTLVYLSVTLVASCAGTMRSPQVSCASSSPLPGDPIIATSKGSRRLKDSKAITGSG